MRIVLQRVKYATVKVNEELCGKTDGGYMLLFGAGQGDTDEIARKLADKVANMRIFADENDKINLSLSDVGGTLLVVPQFTLYADCRKGNRPNFIQAAKPDEANRLYKYFVEYLRSKGFHVETGSFGADMKVELLNDGPFTIILDSETLIK